MSKDKKIINFYEKLDPEKQPKYINKDKDLPAHPFRMSIVGSSGKGKTNIALNILALCDNFDRVIVCAKNIDEPLYRHLKEKLGDDCILCDHFVEKQRDGRPNIFSLSKPRPKNDTTMLTLDEIDNYQGQQIILFDDFVQDNKATQDVIKTYYLRGRKANSKATEVGQSGCSMCYLSQSFFDIPTFIRKNSDYVILKGNFGEKDMARIFREYCTGIDKKTMKAMLEDANKKYEDFFFISVCDDDKRYRKGFYNRYDLTKLKEESDESSSDYSD